MVDHHSMILQQNGRVSSIVISLRDSSLRDSASPRDSRKGFVQVIPMRALSIAAHYDFSIVLKDGEYVWVMGQNNKGQCGDGTRVSKHTFLFTYMISGAKALVEGAHHTMVLTKEGDI